jgi:hypothetical protein
MAEEAVGAGEGVDANRIAWVRETVRMTLDGELATGTARAQNQAGLYRELVNYPMSPELRQHVTTRLTQLQQVDPSISSEPLGMSASVASTGEAWTSPSRGARSASWSTPEIASRSIRRGAVRRPRDVSDTARYVAP